MELTSRVPRQVALLSMVLVIVPVIVFPERFGTDLAHPSLITVLYELVFYGLVLWLFNRHAGLVQLVQAGAVCLVYRLAMGALFGLLIAAMYSMNIRVSIALGMSGYLPVVVFHVVAAPFVLRSALSGLLGERQSRGLDPEDRSQPQPPITQQRATGEERPSTVPVSDPAPPRERTVASQTTEPELKSEWRQEAVEKDTSWEAGVSREASGFERAARYIGEDGAVMMAGVVDPEGLLLGSFSRGDLVAEDWAPYCWLFQESNQTVLTKAKLDGPERVSLLLPDKKIIVAFDSRFALMVVAERQMSDTLPIRVNQALEMVRQYLAQRYSSELFENVETSHVRSA